MDKETEGNTFDKTIIYLDNINAEFANPTECNFYIDIQNIIKSVLYIKILSCSIDIEPADGISNNDPIYVALNDYNRASSVINGARTRFFVAVPLVFTNSQNCSIVNSVATVQNKLIFSGNVEYKTDFDKNDASVYVLNPMEPNLRKFNIQLYDKNNNILQRNALLNFKLTLCVYSSNKKLI